MSASVRWYDGKTCNRLETPPDESSLTQLPFTVTDGSAEAMLTTLLATWREEVSPLIFKDDRCRWLVISGTGPGDLRGYASTPQGECYTVAVETKIARDAKFERGVIPSQFKKAVSQSLDGLKSCRRSYKDDAAHWFKLCPSPCKAAVVLAADSWKLSTEMMESAFQELVNKNVEFLGPQAVLRAVVIGVQRYFDDTRAFVKVETLHDRNYGLK